MKMWVRLLLCFVAWFISHFGLNIGFGFVTDTPPNGLISIINVGIVGLIFYFTREKTKRTS